MSLRDRTKQLLNTPGWPRAAVWAFALALCLVVPGAGAIAAFIWIVALFAIGRQPYSSLGLVLPANWFKVVAFALCIAALTVLVSDYAIEPMARRIAHQPIDTSHFEAIAGNWSKLALFLALSWVVGAVLEETVFRGFLIGFGVVVFGDRWKWLLALASSAAFGLSHLYQGLTGVLVTGVVGFILAVTYLLGNKNLPLVMLVHGFVDTVGIVELFLGSKTTH